MNAAWFSAVIAAVALIISGWTSVRQYRLGVFQAQLSAQQTELADKVATRQQELAIAHSGAQTAMMWRDQVFMLHDRGLTPEEIRWIMCCEDEGVGHEQYNGIIDEIVSNVPRVPPQGLLNIQRDDTRRLLRPSGRMRADLDQQYPFEVKHDDQS